MFFTAWVRDGILIRNPFDGVKGSNAIDESRNHYITADTAKLAMEYCPDAEWRAIFALARFGGLRPGEIFILKFDAIKWERDIIIVTSPKTKRHVGGGPREIPIFPELRPYLLDAAESARDGAVYVLDKLRDRSTGKAKTPNLGKIVNDILEKAGIPKWSKPFVTMRGNYETDLEAKFPLKDVTEWIGNSPSVAKKHYLKSLPENFERATKDMAIFGKDGVSKSVPQNAEGHAVSLDAILDLPACTGVPKIVPAPAGNSVQTAEMNLYQQSQIPIITSPCNSVQEADSVQDSQGGTIKESCKPYYNNGLCDFQNSHCAKTCALLGNPALSPDDRQALQLIISLWPGLPPEMKMGIHHMIDAASRVHAGAW